MVASTYIADQVFLCSRGVCQSTFFERVNLAMPIDAQDVGPCPMSKMGRGVGIIRPCAGTPVQQRWIEVRVDLGLIGTQIDRGISEGKDRAGIVNRGHPLPWS